MIIFSARVRVYGKDTYTLQLLVLLHLGVLEVRTLDAVQNKSHLWRRHLVA